MQGIGPWGHLRLFGACILLLAMAAMPIAIGVQTYMPYAVNMHE